MMWLIERMRLGTKETARGLFPDSVYCEIDAEEVPLKSFVDC